MDKELLRQYGIDYDKGLSNCMGDVAFYKTLMGMFLDDDCFPRARAAYAQHDYATLFSCLHELKGVSGNAALTELYKAVVPLVELLRGGTSDDAAVDTLFSQADAAYQRACEGISLALR